MTKPSYQELELMLWKTQRELNIANITLAQVAIVELDQLIEKRTAELRPQQGLQFPKIGVTE